MSKTRIFLLVTALVWAGLWGMGSVLFFRGARSQDREADRLAMPTTGLQRGADVRLDGILDDQEPVTAPLSEKKCAAARMEVSYVTTYYDAQNKTQRASYQVATRWVPQRVGVFVEGERVELPLEYWAPPASKSGDSTSALDELPARLGVTEGEVARAKEAAGSGSFVQFTVEEWRLMGAQHVFILAHLEEHDGRLELGPDRALGKITIFRGSQADAVKSLRDNASGLRIGGGIFVGLASLPLVAFGLVLLRRRRQAE